MLKTSHASWARNLASLGDLCSIKGGGTPSKKVPEYYLGHIPWATVKDFKTLVIADTEDHITGEAVRASATNVVPAGTVLVVSRVGLGKVAIAGRDMAINQDIKALIPGKRLLPEYLFWFLLSRSGLIQDMGAGATVKGITLNQLKGLMVPVPRLSEQRRIVDLLSRAESIVRLRREAERKVAELTPALFISMFGEPATNTKRWPMVRLGEAIDSADYGSSAKASTEGPGLPIIRMGNVDYAGNLDTSDLKYVEIASDALEKYRLHAGDILFNRTNSRDLVGKTGVWDGRYEAIAASYFIRVRVNRSSLNPFYLWSFMNTAYMKRVLRETARGAIGQSNINAKELRRYHIPIPPISLQETFEQRRQEIVANEAQQGSATAKALTIFEVLLHQIFSRGLDGKTTLLHP